jgi:hypothetical protein
LIIFDTHLLAFGCYYNHEGVVVFGKEYYFGGGIQAGTPFMTPYGRPVEVVSLGETHIPKGRNCFADFLFAGSVTGLGL